MAGELLVTERLSFAVGGGGIESIWSHFDYIVTVSSGSIGLGLGISLDDAAAIVCVIDTDGNGTVSMNEFIEHYIANY